MRRLLLRLRRSTRGTALIEFAVVLPMLMMLIFGIVAYGQYFLIAHSVQELANDAARATVAGLSSDERRTIAQASVASEAAALGSIDATRVTSVVAESGQTVIVTVRVDASATLFRTALLPMPSAIVERRAVVRIGGLT